MVERTAGIGGLSGSALTIQRSATLSGALSVKTGIATKGYLSGSTVFSFGLGSCSNATTSKLLYNNSTGQFSCGTDQAGGGGGGSTFVAKSTAYTAVNGDYILGNVAAGSFDITLPAPTAGNVVAAQVVKNTNTGSRTMTIKTPSATALILKPFTGTGQTNAPTMTGTIVLDGTGSKITLQADGTNWYFTNDQRLKHAAKLQLNTAQTITGTEKVLPKAVKFNIGQIADPVNSQIVIKRTGLYQVSAFCSLSLGAQFGWCHIYRNGTSVATTSIIDTIVNEGYWGVQKEMYLNKGDYIELYMRHGTSGPTIAGENTAPSISVREL